MDRLVDLVLLLIMLLLKSSYHQDQQEVKRMGIASLFGLRSLSASHNNKTRSKLGQNSVKRWSAAARKENYSVQSAVECLVEMFRVTLLPHNKPQQSHHTWTFGSIQGRAGTRTAGSKGLWLMQMRSCRVSQPSVRWALCSLAGQRIMCQQQQRAASVGAATAPAPTPGTLKQRAAM